MIMFFGYVVLNVDGDVIDEANGISTFISLEKGIHTPTHGAVARMLAKRHHGAAVIEVTSTLKCYTTGETITETTTHTTMLYRMATS